MQITYADFFTLGDTQERLGKSGLKDSELSAVRHALKNLSEFFSCSRNRGKRIEQEVSFLGHWTGSRHDLLKLLKDHFVDMEVGTSAPDGRFTVSFSPKKEVWMQYSRPRELWIACRSPAVQTST